MQQLLTNRKRSKRGRSLTLRLYGQRTRVQHLKDDAAIGWRSNDIHDINAKSFRRNYGRDRLIAIVDDQHSTVG